MRVKWIVLAAVILLVSIGAGAWLSFQESKPGLVTPSEQVPESPNTSPTPDTPELFSQPSGAEEAYRQGEELKAEGRLKEAALRFLESTKLRPSYVAAHEQYLDVSLLRGRRKEFLEKYRKLSEASPDDPIPPYILGLVGESPQEAKKMFRESLRRQPDFAPAANGLAMVYEGLGGGKSAIKWYKKAAKNDPENTEYHVALATMYLAEGYYRRAEQTMEKALAVDPGNAHLYYLMGLLQSDQEKNDDARKYFEKASSLDQSYSPDGPLRESNMGGEKRGN